jgi:hypothetical protein
MAVRYIGMTLAAATTGPIAGRSQVIGASSGGTLAGSQVVQVVYDDTVFATGNSSDAKQRLINALESIIEAINMARVFPVDTTT